MRRRTLWITGLVALGSVATGFFYLRFFQAPEVAVVTPRRGAAVEAVYATGTVEPKEFARVGSTIPGRVREVLVSEGQTVARGETLLTLDAREDEARVQELEARLTLAVDDLERTRALRRSGHVSAAQLEQARNTHAAAVAALQGAQARLDDHTVDSPLRGTVLRSEQRIRVGDMVQAGQVLFLVGDPGRLQIDAEVDEEDVVKVAVGQEALLRADAFPGQALTGSVSGITPYGDPVARSYRIVIAVPADTPLVSGMTTEINIVVRHEDNALLVPIAALAGDRVWTVVDDHAQPRSIEIGAVGAEDAEILAGLADDAVVIIHPPQHLVAGTRVRPRPSATESR